MAESLQIVANAVRARLLGASQVTRLAVNELLSYQIEEAPGAQRFSAGDWDGRESFYDYATNTFPAGFVHEVGRALIAQGHHVQFAIKQAPAPLGPAPGTNDPQGLGFAERYLYQIETVRRLLKHRRMVARVATGGGKSRIGVLAVDALRRPTLFLTTRGALMHQMKTTFEKAGYTPGVMGDGVWAPRKGVNVAMVQTIAARLGESDARREKTLALLSYFEFIIGEEAHEAGGTSYYEILQACRNAHYRLALTATPFMRPDGEANMRLQAAFGSIGIEVPEKLLIERGILATPYFRMPRAEAPALLRRHSRWPACYDLGIVENTQRNKAITLEVTQAARHGLPVMTLVQRERHGEALNEMFRQAGLRSAFIFGKHEQTVRKTALTDLASGTIQALIGSTILDVGVDVPAVGLVVIAGAGKAEVGHRQRIGRGLREKKTGANIAFIYDFMDERSKYLQEHSLTRRAIIESTPGFAENLLGESEAFPYHLLKAA